MAWSRRPRGRRRRFFRRSGRRIRPTTEQGAGRRSYERSFFNVIVDNLIDGADDTSTYNTFTILSGNSLIAPFVATGNNDALALARVLQQPIKGFDLLAIQFDLTAELQDGLVPVQLPFPLAFSTFDSTVRAGFAVYSDRLNAGGSSATTPQYDESQWPVLQSATPTATDDDVDHPLRTHVQRSTTFFPTLYADPGVAGDSGSLVHPGWPRFNTSVRLKLRRRLSDTQGVFFQAWNRTPLTNWTGSSTSIIWRLTGSLWYRMVW